MTVRALSLLPLALLVWAGVTTSGFLRADFALNAGGSKMLTWRSPPTSTPTGARLEAIQDLRNALRYTPRSPAILELLGLSYGSAMDSQEAVEKSASYLKASLRERPSSPYTWASLAEVHYLSGNIGREFQLSMNHAAELGPNEPEVQRMVVDYGLATFLDLDEDTKGTVMATVVRMANQRPVELLRIAERRGRLDWICKQIHGTGAVAELTSYQTCQSREDP
jgi:hypothetical protein